MSYENTTHKLNLTGGQISTILYCLEGYISGLDEAIYDEITTVTKDQDDTFKRDVDSIFETLEGVVDAFYSQEKVKKLPCNDLKIIPPNPYVKDSPSLPERY